MGSSPLFKLLVPVRDQAQDLLSSRFFYGAGDKILRQELPGFPHFFEERLHVRADRALAFLVGFRKNEREGHLPFAEAIDELEVELLRRMAAIYEHKDIDEVLAFAQIIFDHLLPFL